MGSKTIDRPTLAITYSCSLLSLGLIAIRLICRRMRGEKYLSFPDDVWMGFSVLPLLIRLGIVHMVLMYGTNAVSPDRLATLTEDDIRQRAFGSKLVLVSRIAYPAFLWCMKACILAFLGRLMSAECKYRIVLLVIGQFLVFTFIGNVLATLFECRPFYKHFQVVPSPGAPCTKAHVQLFVMGITNIMTDLSLIILPLPLIVRSRLPLLRKIQLSLLFGIGVAVIAVTIIRLPLILASSTMQSSRTLWASIEILVACAVANAPILNSFHHEYKKKRRSCIGNLEDAEEDELRSGYSTKLAKLSLKRKVVETVSGSHNGCPRKGHARDHSEESLTRLDGGSGGAAFVIEVGTPKASTHHLEDQEAVADTKQAYASVWPPPADAVARGHKLRLAMAPTCTFQPLDIDTHDTHSRNIQASTEVSMTVSHATPEEVRRQKMRYYQGDFLGTQVWADQVFPGPKDPTQHVNYGMKFSGSGPTSPGPSHRKRPSHTFADIPGLGVLPPPPPLPPQRAHLSAISGRKSGDWSLGSEGAGSGILRQFARRDKAGESAEELQLGRLSRTSLVSHGDTQGSASADPSGKDVSV